MRAAWIAFLKDILPADWTWSDRDPFYFNDANSTLQWKSVASTADGDVLSEQYESGTLRLDLSVTRYAQQQTAMVTYALTNTGATGCFLHKLHLVDLHAGSAHGPVHFRSVDGGSNVKHYPPEIFKVNDYLCDGSSGIWREHGWDGRSSEDTLPLLGLELGTGAVIAGLEWSGLWWGAANGSDNGDKAASAHLTLSIPVEGLELKPGERFGLPAAHLAFSSGGLEGAGNNCRHHIAANISPALNGEKITQPPAVYNHWFGLGPNINEQILIQQADKAADIGAEYFVLDAGWYGDCDGDNFETGVGNWEIVDKNKFPNGISPLAKHVRDLGLKFGIWFEPERAHVKSDWYRRHPEWFLKRGNENDSFLHIDMSNPEVQENVVRVVSSTISELNCEWIKWDYNINPKTYWLENDPTGRLMFDYMNGLYAVQQRLLDAHPEVLFECCASGGRRIDLGQMRRTHIALLSDSASSSLVCRFMQTGANTFLPASYLGVGLPFGDIDTNPNSNEGELRDFQLLSRMCGAPVVYGNIASLSDERRGVLTRNFEVFKQFRHLLNQDFYRLLPQAYHQDDYDAVEFVSTDRKDAVVLVFSGPEKMRYVGPVHPKALLADTHYAAEVIAGAPSDIRGGTGEELMSTGREIALEPREAVAIRLKST